MTAPTVWDQVVIGGGVMGLATAVELARRGARVTLLEQHTVGAEHGSSHGQSRVSRTTYADPVFARLMAVARAEDWPRLEAAAGQALVHAKPGCFFGPRGGLFDDYLATMRSAELAMEVLSAREARRRFPMLALPECDEVIVDPSAGIISAKDTVETLLWLARRNGVEIREHTRVAAVERGGPHIRVHLTEADSLETERAVITTGPWAARLAPELESHLRVVRQTVAFFEPPVTMTATDLEAFPIWASLGRTVEEVFYGLPAFGRPGLKIARHELRGRRDDPDREATHISSTAIARLRFELGEQLGAAPGPLAGAETCLYTCTPDERFVLDVHPNDSRVVIGAGFSGHGFKFAPLIGRILAGLALEGRSDIDVFEAERRRFAFPGEGQA